MRKKRQKNVRILLMRRKKLLKKVDRSKITRPLSFIKNRNNKKK